MRATARIVFACYLGQRQEGFCGGRSLGAAVSDTPSTTSLHVASRIDWSDAHRASERDVNPASHCKLLNFGVNLAPDTVFADVKRLTARSYLSVAPERSADSSRYWDMRYEHRRRHETKSGSEPKLESMVERSVAAHCPAQIRLTNSALS